MTAPARDADPVALCELRVSGMDCASCARTIESALGRLNGVRDVRVDVVGGRVRVAYAEGALAPPALAGAVRRAGFAVDEPQTAARPWQGAPLAAVAGVALVLGLLLGWMDLELASVALLAVSTVAGGWRIVPQGLRALRARALDMHFLMTVAAAGAWAIGEPEEAAATLFLFSIAELLERRSMDRARHAIRALMELAPAEATVLRAGAEVRVPVGDVRVGETVLVRPGEKVAVDGAVTAGRSAVNEAPITGESMPVEKEAGAEVFAGSLNGHGALEVRADRPASDTTLARVIHAVEEAQASRAPTQTFVERFARVYTPLVVLGALLLAVLPPLLGFGAWGEWTYRALAVLVVACPCALVISTPVALVSGLTGAARRGILIKGGAHLERAGQATVVCIDKTGTLTEGHPAVTDVVPLGGATEADVLHLALGVERRSEHPLARAVMAEGVRRGLATPESRDFVALVGAGAEAEVDGVRGLVGSERMLRERGVEAGPALPHLARLEAEGKTAVAVVADGRAIGVLALADRPRANARLAVERLRAEGVRRVVMLTGDNAGTAAAVARQVGIAPEDVRAGLLPADKVAAVREIGASGETVLFVGDGVNDAPALAAAHVGVAMGAAGTDVALETADVALMADDLEKLPLALRYSRRTLGIVKQNVVASLLVKAVFLVLATGGWATLWMAVAADTGASLLVVANGLRARRA